MKLLVTGGAGFIGSNFVAHRLGLARRGHRPGARQADLRGRRENLDGPARGPARVRRGRHRRRRRRPRRGRGLRRGRQLRGGDPTSTARSSRPASSSTPTSSAPTSCSRRAATPGIRHLQVSTDEVYGDLEEGTATETSAIEPSSPYAASKAGGDMLVSAFARTYGAEALIIRASNNYGPRQHPEKLIPLCVLNALAGRRAARLWRRDAGPQLALRRGLLRRRRRRARARASPGQRLQRRRARRAGRTSTSSRSILELTGRDESLISYVKDRPGHDRRYSLSSDRLEALGWSAAVPFDEGIARTVDWYRDNEDWWGPIRSGEYREYYERHYGKALGS